MPILRHYAILARLLTLICACLVLAIPLARADVDPLALNDTSGTCLGFANFADEIKARDFHIVNQTSQPDGTVQVEIGFTADNVDHGRFITAELLPDMDVLVSELGAIRELAVPANLGAVASHATGMMPVSSLLVTVPAANVTTLLDRLNSGAVPITINGEEDRVEAPGLTIVHWGSVPGAFIHHDDGGYAYARDVYGLNPEPVPPYQAGYTFSIISQNDGSGNSQVSVFDDWTPGNDKFYVVKGPWNPNPFTNPVLYNVPDILQHLHVLNVVKTVDSDANITRWDITAEPKLDLAALYTSASFCSGKTLHIDHDVHRSRLEIVDGRSPTDPSTPPPVGEERDRAPQPIRFNNIEPVEGITLSGQIEGHVIKPHFEMRLRNGQTRISGTFDTDLTLTAEARAYKAVDVGGEDKDKKLYDLCFPVASIDMGFARLYINLNLEHIVGYQGNMELEAVVGVQKRFHTLSQVGYDSRLPEGEKYFKNDRDLSPPTDFTPPQLTDRTQAHAKIYTRMTPTLFVSLEDPQCRSGGKIWADVTAWGTGDVTPTQDPWWRLGTGVDLDGGIGLDLFGFNLVGHDFAPKTIVHDEWSAAPGTAPLAVTTASQVPGTKRLWQASMDGAVPAVSPSPRISGEDQRWSISVDNLDVHTFYNKTSVAATADNGVLVTALEDIPGRGSLLRLDDHGAYQWGLKFKLGLDPIKVLTLPDQGFFLAGQPHWLSRHDAAGNVIWARDLVSADGSPTCTVNSAAWFESSPGNYEAVLVGKVVWVTPGDTEACAMRVDNNGNVLWVKTYNGPFVGENQTFHGATVTGDGQIVAVGETWVRDPAHTQDGLMVKMDLDGNVVWSRRYGMGVLILDPPPGYSEPYRGEKLYGVAEGPDGMLLAAGAMQPSVDWTGSAWLLRVESDGVDYRSATLHEDPNWEKVNFGEWQDTQGGHTAWDVLYDITPMSEGFAVVGKTGLPPPHGGVAAWAAKLNTHFGPEWMATYDGAGVDTLDGVAATADGLFVSGFSYSVPGTSPGESELLIMKLPVTGRNTLLPEAHMVTHYSSPGVNKNGGFGQPLYSKVEPLAVNARTYSANDIVGFVVATPPRLCVTKLSKTGHASILDACDRTEQVIDFDQRADKTYGDADFDVTVTGGGSGNPVVVSSLSPTVCEATGDNGHTITLMGAGSCDLRASQAGNVDYEAAADSYVTFRVLPITLGVSGLAAQEKTYDGGVVATLVGVAILHGVRPGDDVALGGTPVGRFDDANAGPDKPVTITGLMLTGARSANYQLVDPITVTANIFKAHPMITWTTPADILAGTALSALQLNASADVPGTFLYSPAAGSVLPAGTHVLSTGFTPDDGVNYESVAATTVSLRILPVVTRTYSAPSPSGGGDIRVDITGGGPDCTFTRSRIAALPSMPPPAGVRFWHGLFDFALGGCDTASRVTIVITYPNALPAGTTYWKYGPTPDNATAHWYRLTAADNNLIIAGNVVSFSITDGGLGDDDLAANGTIVDEGGAGSDASARDVPAMTLTGLVLMALALTVLGCAARRRRVA